MKFYTQQGISIEVAEGVLLVNGKPPHLTDLGSGFWKASTTFRRVKRPDKSGSCRKRKKALMAATKKFSFSFSFQKGN